MADTAKKAESKPDEGAESKTAESLTSDFGRKLETRAFGEVHEFEFADGTSAKVWSNTGDSHVNVQFRDVNGRGRSDTTHEGLTVNAANKMIADAGQKGIDQAKPEGS